MKEVKIEDIDKMIFHCLEAEKLMRLGMLDSASIEMLSIFDFLNGHMKRFIHSKELGFDNS